MRPLVVPSLAGATESKRSSLGLAGRVARATALLAAALGGLAADALLAAELPPAPGAAAHDTVVCTARCPGLEAVEIAEPALSRREATVLGLASGLGLGLGLSGRWNNDAGAPLEGWRPADGLALGGAAALYLVPMIVWSHEAPDLLQGRWTDCDRSDARQPRDRLDGFDRAVRSLLTGAPRRDPRELRRRLLFDNLSYGTLAASVTLPWGASGQHPERDLLVTVEAVGLAAAASGAVKHVFHRPRPFVHFCDPVDPAGICQHDAQQSFFSGHTAMAFAGAVAAGRLASLRGARNESAIWASGLTLATSTGLLRIAADKHYATDVLAGLVVGGAAGWWVPLLHRPSATRPEDLARTPAAPGGAIVQLPVRLPALGPSSVGIGLAQGGPSVWVSRRW